MIMPVDKFQRILNSGMGRAILYLQQNDSTPYREVILNACLHTTAYDAQVEGSRAEYMHDIIQLTHDVDFYRNEILNALSQSNESDWDVRHLLDQAAIFAKSGDEHARQLVYDTILNPLVADPPFDILVEMDGVKGLIAIIETIWNADPQEKQDLLTSYGDYLLRLIEDQEGAYSHLTTIAETQPNVKEFIEGVLTFRSKSRDPQKLLNSSQMSYDDLLTWFSNASNFHNPPVNWSTWGKYASDEDIQLAAQDLLSLPEDKVQKITIYLKMFQNRVFPLDPTRLITWASQIDDRSVWQDDGTINYDARRSLYALNALELVMDWAVRDLALSLIESKNNVGRAVGLLALNFVIGDWQLIEELSQSNMNAEDYHSFGFSVRDVFDAHPTLEAASVLQNLYELGTCSQCRERVVKQLASLNAIPEWILEECKYDCNLDLRQWSLNASIQ